ncbi:hypothetical protein ABZY02_27110 [Streptomyces sp. NPDC006649]|uniref:hypothetical protein n=1 Tax=Streptomyces sp. NPDC006649 TaxID=3156896 RepID=UPI0033BD5030
MIVVVGNSAVAPRLSENSSVMEFENKDSTRELSRFLNIDLYPDLIQLGGLAAAMSHVAEENGIELPPVRPQSVSGRAQFSTARVESADGVILILLGLDERWFSISLEGEINPWAAGGTGDLRAAVEVVDAWHRGASLDELGKRFPFMHCSELTHAYESGDPVVTQWDRLLSDGDFSSARPLLREIRSSDRLCLLFPFFSHGVLRLAMDHLDRSAGEIWITPLPGTRYRVELTNSGVADEEVQSMDHVIETILSLLDHS